MFLCGLHYFILDDSLLLCKVPNKTVMSKGERSKNKTSLAKYVRVNDLTATTFMNNCIKIMDSCNKLDF